MMPPRLRLSQAQLNLLERCPRKFQYMYLDQRVAPASPQEIERQQWGSQFHLTMQQRELGVLKQLEPESRLSLSNDFQRAAQALIAALPDVFDGTRASDRHSEHRRSLRFDDYLLTAVYDLVVLSDHQAQIFDWKTYRKPQNRGGLAKSWQTRLYPFVLAETTDYAPEAISMTYWFISPRQLQQASASHEADPNESQNYADCCNAHQATRPEAATFAYSTQQHNTIRHQLHDLLATLTQHLEAADRQSASAAAPYLFPQIPEQGEVCPSCPYALRCGRSPQGSARDWFDVAALVDIDAIEEVSL